MLGWSLEQTVTTSVRQLELEQSVLPPRLSFTARLAISSSVAFFPSSLDAASATEPRPCSRASSAWEAWRTSKKLEGDRRGTGGPVAFCCFARNAAVAPLMAPQLVWPKTKISRVFRAPVQNSRLPRMLPSAWVPAQRTASEWAQRHKFDCRRQRRKARLVNH